MQFLDLFIGFLLVFVIYIMFLTIGFGEPDKKFWSDTIAVAH